jgi:hypothetical protein
MYMRGKCNLEIFCMGNCVVSMCIYIYYVRLYVYFSYVIGICVLFRLCVCAISVALEVLSEKCVYKCSILFYSVCKAGSMESASIYMTILVDYYLIRTIRYKCCVTRLDLSVFK